jgi:hypothetical protein
MAETPVNMGFTDASEARSTPALAPAASPPPQQQPARTPNTRGHSGALDHREQQPSAGERMSRR